MEIAEPAEEVVLEEYDREGAKLERRLTIAGKTYASSRKVEGSDDCRGDWWKAYLAGQDSTAATPPTKTVRVVDLFCGSGGLSLGFSEACSELGLGTRSELAVDQDVEAVRVYAANHETRRRSTDSVSQLADYQVAGQGDKARFVYEPEIIMEEVADLVGNTDVILAGPPCQGHSNLNNQTRRSDKRNELYLAVPAIGLALRSRCIIIENVPAVVHDTRQVVQSTRRLLEDAGYFVETGVLSASKMGWPQSRQRFFLIARLDVAPLPIAAIAAGLAQEPRGLEWAIGDLVDVESERIPLSKTALSQENQRRIDWLFDHDEFDLPPSERPDCHKNGTTYNAVYGRLHLDRPAPTITTGFMTPGRGRYIHPTQRRVLSAHEAARIQGFPDNYIFQPDPSVPLSKQKISKWIGDAVPMPLGFGAALSALGPGWD
jgi:DNA (cytosine-5)-methyltransferase 1